MILSSKLGNDFFRISDVIFIGFEGCSRYKLLKIEFLFIIGEVDIEDKGDNLFNFIFILLSFSDIFDLLLF